MKQKNNICHWGILSSAAVLAGAGTAQALDASDALVWSKGPVSLRPQFGLVEQFTDNVYYEDSNTVSDLVTIISPGMRFVAGQDLPTENHFIFNYALDQLLYVRETGQNAMQHRFSTDTKFQWSRLSLEGADRLEFLSSALGGGFTLNTREPVDRFVVADFYRVDYKLGERMSVYVEALHNSINYDEGLNLFDSRRLMGSGGFEYLFTGDTRFFGEVYYGANELDVNMPTTAKPPGTTFFGGFVGARGQFTQKLSGRVKAGYESATFDSPDPSGSDSAGDAPVVEANVAFQFSDRGNVGLTYNRRQTVSVQFSRSGYIVDSVTLSATQILGSTGRLKLNAFATYQMLDFEPSPGNYASRNDTSWLFEFGASWYFQTWLSTRLAYNFENYNSDLPSVIDYNVNRITLSLAIGY